MDILGLDTALFVACAGALLVARNRYEDAFLVEGLQLWLPP
jgi:hypothetical protein